VKDVYMVVVSGCQVEALQMQTIEQAPTLTQLIQSLTNTIR
jgi:hypothetical protein